MKELIEISQVLIGTENVNSVNARDLWNSLEIKKEYASWIKLQISNLGLEINVDYISFAQKVKRETGATTKKEYITTLDTAKHISMASRTEKGKEVRKYFIEAEKQLKANQTTNNGIDSVMFNSMMSNQNKLLELFIMQSQKTNMLIENILVNNTKKPQQQNKKSISEEIDTVYSSDYPQEMYNTSNNNYDDLKDKEPENINSRFECIYLPQGRRKILNGMLELFKMKDIEKKHHKGHIYYRLTLAQIEEHLGFTTQKAYIFQTIKILIDKKVIEKLKTSYRNVYFRVTDTIQNFNDEEI